MSEVHLFFNGFCLYSSTLALKMHSVRAGLVYFQVFKSLKYFMKNKDPGDNLFDRLSVSTSPTVKITALSRAKVLKLCGPPIGEKGKKRLNFPSENQKPKCLLNYGFFFFFKVLWLCYSL